MEQITFIRQTAVQSDGQCRVREICYQGTVDESGQLRLHRCTGKFYTRKQITVQAQFCPAQKHAA